MVHALETIHYLLRPEGQLIDIHPVGRPSPVTIRLGERVVPAGFIREEGDFVDYRRAEAALATVVERGLFHWQKQGMFDYTVAAGNVDDMLAHLAANWKRAIVDEAVRQRMVEQMTAVAPDKELRISQAIRIGRLRPLAAND